MPDELTIREAGASEARLIAELSRLTFYESFAAGNTPENMDLYQALGYARLHLFVVGTDPQTDWLMSRPV